MSRTWESLIPPSRFDAPDRTAVSARGHEVTMKDGRSYLCATSGLWNVNLGYGNRKIADAVHSALKDASYLGLFRGGNVYAEHASQELVARGPAGASRVLYSTSGSAANDMVLKLARQFHLLRDEPRRRLAVGLKGSYHGLTYGALSLTGEDLGQRAYGVDLQLVRHVRANDADELRALGAREGHRIGVITIEPVLGSGAVVVDPSVIEAAIDLRREHGIVIVADEVATGFGRTGTFFASEAWPEPPDVLIASKGLTNGTAAAAVAIVGERVVEAFDAADAPFVHGETQAGTPASCAAIVATLAEFDSLRALELAVDSARTLDAMLGGLLDLPLVTGTTGLGGFRSITLGVDGRALDGHAIERTVAFIRRAGALVQPAPSAIQFVPALTYDDADFSRLHDAVSAGLSQAYAQA